MNFRCRIGIHDYEYAKKQFGGLYIGAVQAKRCRRCRKTILTFEHGGMMNFTTTHIPVDMSEDSWKQLVEESKS